MNEPTPGSAGGARLDATAPYVSVGTDADSVQTANTTVSTQSETGPAAVGAEAPATFGDFELLAKIAQGGMGVVYKARDRKLNRVVAVKMILSGRLASDEAVRRFYTEAEAAARLDHPDIVPVYETGTRDGQHYMVMAFIEGGSLATHLKDGPLPPRHAAELTRRLADAIAYAHGKGIIHRDLKPGNVLLHAAGVRNQEIEAKSRTSDANPRITDFGLAKLAQNDSELTATGQVMGTPAYMPPEQAAGRVAEVGPAADIYSLGAILYCTLTGRPPFQAATPVETLRLVLEREPVAPRLLNPSVPRDLETICLKCLYKDAPRRYSSAAALADDLRRFLAGRPIIARTAGPIERSAKWIRRNPLAAGLIVALTVGVVGSSSGAVIAWRQRDRAVAAEQQRSSEAQQRAEEQRQRLIDSHLAAANLAFQRGAWREAVAAYESAEAEGLTLTIPMRLKRVRALFSLSQITRVQQELDALTADADELGEQRALVDLYRGDLQLGVNNVEAERLLQRALAGKLPESDAWYARGLLARRTAEALRCFHNAVAADRFHREARGFIGMMLPILGRTDEGLRWLEQCELLFPEDPQFQLLLGMCYELRGDPQAAEPRWQRIAPVFPLETSKMVRQMFAMFPKLGPILEKSAGLRDEADMGPTIQAALAYNQLRAVAGRMQQVTRPLDSNEDAIVQAPVLRVPFALQPMHQFLNHIANVIDADRRGQDLVEQIVHDEKRFAELIQLIDALDEGLSRYYHGFLLLSRALHFAFGPNRDDLKLQAGMREAAAVYDRARRQPGLVDARMVAWHGYVMAVAHLGAPGRAGYDATMQPVAVKEIRDLMRRGPLPGSTRSIYLKAARNAKDWNLARDILDEWERRSPNDMSAVRGRAEIELAATAYASAIIAAKKCLQHDPKDAIAQRVLVEAQAKLQKQYAELAVKN